MKKHVRLDVLVLIATIPVVGGMDADRWKVFDFDPDALTGKSLLVGARSAYVGSADMAFPYEGVRGALYFRCKIGGSSEAAWIRFTEVPNLVGGEYLGNYAKPTTYSKVRYAIDGNEDRITLMHTIDSKDLDFMYAVFAIQAYRSVAELAIEVPWYGSGNAIFRFSLAGASEAIDRARQRCSQ